jgi:hypothetical protein
LLAGGWTTTGVVDVEECWTQGFSMGGGEPACRNREVGNEADSVIWEETHHECQHNAIPGTRIRREDDG